MNTIKYISTRGRTTPMSFRDAVMTGLAPDGGLLIPEDIPDVGDRLDAWSGLPYRRLAWEIMRLYTDLPEPDLRESIQRAYSGFRHPEVTPLTSIGPLRVMELFHGPTLAFKDIALQWLGDLFETILEERGGELNILAATSGDTGSAAIHGVRGRAHIRIFVMHPDGRISPLQKRQMTAVLDDNVFNMAVQGTFDDCQSIMKRIFNDADFKRRHSLGAVNSVNWARVLAQVVYYFYAGLKVMREEKADTVQFAVPTGNFGDILAGYYARRMGLPVKRLILATNENDILARFFNTGEYSLGDVVHTLSPSMDIQVASNFERFLYYRLEEDPDRLRAMMREFENGGCLRLADGKDPGQGLFAAERATTGDTLGTIESCYREYDRLLDPHTAVGVHAAHRHLDRDAPTICLATAHPAKFSEAIRKATGRDIAGHEILDKLRDAPTRCDRLPADEQAVRDFIARRA